MSVSDTPGGQSASRGSDPLAVTDWVERAFGDSWILPVAGLILLPWTTALYTVGFVAGDAAAPWGILGAIIGLFLDVAVHAGSATMTRRRYSS